MVFTSVPKALQSIICKQYDIKPEGFALIIKEIPNSIVKLGINKTDIVYAYNMQISYHLLNAVLKESGLSLSKINSNSVDVKVLDELVDMISFFSDAPNIFIYDIHYPIADNKIRLYDIELNFNFNDSILQSYKRISFSAGDIENPPLLLNEPIRDLLGSLQLDGFTKLEAIDYILENNLVDNNIKSILSSYSENIKLPDYFYQSPEEIKNAFIRN